MVKGVQALTNQSEYDENDSEPVHQGAVLSEFEYFSGCDHESAGGRTVHQQEYNVYSFFLNGFRVMGAIVGISID